MTHLESDRIVANSPTKAVFDFVLDMNNIIELLPPEKVDDWKSDNNSCSFTIKGLAGIGMKLASSTPPSKITLVAHGKNPFDFTLNILFSEVNENRTEVHIEFDANMNMMIEMMAKGPLTNLFNIMANNLKEKFS